MHCAIFAVNAKLRGFIGRRKRRLAVITLKLHQEYCLGQSPSRQPCLVMNTTALPLAFHRKLLLELLYHQFFITVHFALYDIRRGVLREGVGISVAINCYCRTGCGNALRDRYIVAVAVDGQVQIHAGGYL